MKRNIEVTLSLAAIALAAIIVAAIVGEGSLATAFVGIDGTAAGALGGISVQRYVNGQR